MGPVEHSSLCIFFMTCRLQEVRLELLKTLLRKREENRNELDVSRLDAQWFNLMREKEEKVKRIQHENIKGNMEVTA